MTDHYQHTRNRLIQRHGIEINPTDYGRLCALAVGNKAPVVDHHMGCWYLPILAVPFKGKRLRVMWNSLEGCVVTVGANEVTE